MKIIRSGNTLTANIKKLNIKIDATWHSRYMNFNLLVPCRLCEVSFGHLGNCDGNPNNDVSGPNDRECDSLSIVIAIKLNSNNNNNY